MAELLLLTPTTGGPEQVLPALGLLAHQVRTVAPEPSALLEAPDVDALLVDARTDLAAARATCRLLHATGLTVPLVLVVTEGGLTAVTAEWGASDVVLASASPAEVEARLRLAVERGAGGGAPGQGTRDRTAAGRISAGDLTIDADTWTVRLRGRPLDLTYKEFELLRHLAQHPGRVFTRDRLLQEVWGYDYFGGSRTVDVHVRRLRAKLGPEHEQLIGTVRNVGYRFDAPGREPSTQGTDRAAPLT